MDALAGDYAQDTKRVNALADTISGKIAEYSLAAEPSATSGPSVSQIQAELSQNLQELYRLAVRPDAGGVAALRALLGLCQEAQGTAAEGELFGALGRLALGQGSRAQSAWYDIKRRLFAVMRRAQDAAASGPETPLPASLCNLIRAAALAASGSGAHAEQALGLLISQCGGVLPAQGIALQIRSEAVRALAEVVISDGPQAERAYRVLVRLDYREDGRQALQLISQSRCLKQEAARLRLLLQKEQAKRTAQEVPAGEAAKVRTPAPHETPEESRFLEAFELLNRSSQQATMADVEQAWHLYRLWVSAAQRRAFPQLVPQTREALEQTAALLREGGPDTEIGRMNPHRMRLIEIEKSCDASENGLVPEGLQEEMRHQGRVHKRAAASRQQSISALYQWYSHLLDSQDHFRFVLEASDLSPREMAFHEKLESIEESRQKSEAAGQSLTENDAKELVLYYTHWEKEQGSLAAGNDHASAARLVAHGNNLDSFLRAETGKSLEAWQIELTNFQQDCLLIAQAVTDTDSLARRLEAGLRVYSELPPRSQQAVPEAASASPPDRAARALEEVRQSSEELGALAQVEGPGGVYAFNMLRRLFSSYRLSPAADMPLSVLARIASLDGLRGQRAYSFLSQTLHDSSRELQMLQDVAEADAYRRETLLPALERTALAAGCALAGPAQRAEQALSDLEWLSLEHPQELSLQRAAAESIADAVIKNSPAAEQICSRLAQNTSRYFAREALARVATSSSPRSPAAAGQLFAYYAQQQSTAAVSPEHAFARQILACGQNQDAILSAVEKLGELANRCSSGEEQSDGRLRALMTDLAAAAGLSGRAGERARALLSGLESSHPDIAAAARQEAAQRVGRESFPSAPTQESFEERGPAATPADAAPVGEDRKPVTGQADTEEISLRDAVHRAGLIIAQAIEETAEVRPITELRLRISSAAGQLTSFAGCNGEDGEFAYTLLLGLLEKAAAPENSQSRNAAIAATELSTALGRLAAGNSERAERSFQYLSTRFIGHLDALVNSRATSEGKSFRGSDAEGHILSSIANDVRALGQICESRSSFAARSFQLINRAVNICRDSWQVNREAYGAYGRSVINRAAPAEDAYPLLVVEGLQVEAGHENELGNPAAEARAALTEISASTSDRAGLTAERLLEFYQDHPEVHEEEAQKVGIIAARGEKPGAVHPSLERLVIIAGALAGDDEAVAALEQVVRDLITGMRRPQGAGADVEGINARLRIFIPPEKLQPMLARIEAELDAQTAAARERAEALRQAAEGKPAEGKILPLKSGAEPFPAAKIAPGGCSSDVPLVLSCDSEPSSPFPAGAVTSEAEKHAEALPQGAKGEPAAENAAEVRRAETAPPSAPPPEPEVKQGPGEASAGKGLQTGGNGELKLPAAPGNRVPSRVAAAVRSAGHTTVVSMALSAIELLKANKLDEKTWNMYWPNIPFTRANIGYVLGLPESMIAYQTGPGALNKIKVFGLTTASTTLSLLIFKGGDQVLTRVAAKGWGRWVEHKLLKEAAARGAVDAAGKLAAKEGAKKAEQALVNRTLGSFFGPAFGFESGLNTFTKEGLVHDSLGWNYLLGLCSMAQGMIVGGPRGVGASVIGMRVNTLLIDHELQADGAKKLRTAAVLATVERSAELGLKKPEGELDNPVGKEEKEIFQRQADSTFAALAYARAGLAQMTQLDDEQLRVVRKRLETIEQLLLSGKQESFLGAAWEFAKRRTSLSFLENTLEQYGKSLPGPTTYSAQREELSKTLGGVSLSDRQITALIECNNAAKELEPELEGHYRRAPLVRFNVEEGKKLVQYDELEHMNGEFTGLANQWINQKEAQDLLVSLRHTEDYKRLKSDEERIKYLYQHEQMIACRKRFIKEKLPVMQAEFIQRRLPGLPQALLVQGKNPSGVETFGGRDLLEVTMPAIFASAPLQQEILAADEKLRARAELNREMLSLLPPDEQQLWQAHQEGRTVLTLEQLTGLLHRASTKQAKAG